MSEENKNYGGTRLAEGDGVSVSVPTDAASHAAPTKGPWKADRMGCFVFALDGQFPVCETRGWGYLTGYEKRTDENATAIQQANAHLIAAAPEMYEALKRAEAFGSGIGELTLACAPTETDRECWNRHQREVTQLRHVAIAKAEGRSTP